MSAQGILQAVLLIAALAVTAASTSPSKAPSLPGISRSMPAVTPAPRSLVAPQSDMTRPP